MRDDAAPDLVYAAARLGRLAFPKLHITAPAEGVQLERDVDVPLSDGVRLRVNVFRPTAAGRYPVLMCAHPYGKDALPAKILGGYLPSMQYRAMRQPDVVRFSAWTSWEAPDPSFWCPRGYALVNADLRGFGHSQGIGELFSAQEAQDYAELIAWAAAQPWSTGKVGLNGVSYLALSQWNVAATRPPALAAICPWEGFSDVYQDLAYPGGVREDGFVPFWGGMTERAGRTTYSLRERQLAHPNRDDFWRALAPALDRIEVPALVCGSFSDHALHTRGSFEGFRRIASADRFLYTHRGGKWSTYYSDEALALQARFFDCYLKGEANGMRSAPRIHLEVRSDARTVQSVRSETSWPPPGAAWQKLHLAPGRLQLETSAAITELRLALPQGRLSFLCDIPEELVLAGPMKLALRVSLEGASDAHLFAGLRKVSNGRVVPFEGSYGFGRDTLARGMLRLAHRRLDPARSEPHRPFHPCDRPEPLSPGEIADVEIEILPSATWFRRGDQLRLDLQGSFFWNRNPLFGFFPGAYQQSPAGRLILHLGGASPAHLLVPQAN